jgi:hypothetical protein
MDGYRSGRPNGARTQVEQCVALSSSWLLQNNYFALAVSGREYHSITWSNLLRDPVYTLAFDLERSSPTDLRLYLRNSGQLVYLHPTELNFGGFRWWFACPQCERRCAKLYLQRSAFLCRTCHDLTYQSCIGGKATTAFLASLAAQQGWTAASVKQALADYRRMRNRWKRKRDRRPGYKRRGLS